MTAVERDSGLGEEVVLRVPAKTEYIALVRVVPVSYTHLTLPTIYSV